MCRLDRRACALLAWLALAGLADPAPVDARGAEPVHEQRPSERARQAHREAGARPSHPNHAARVQGAHPAAGREVSPVRAHQAANYPRETVNRSIPEVREAHSTGGARMRAMSHGPAGNQVRVVRYGNGVSGTVERSIRPGLVSRTFVGGGHVLYSRVYQRQVWHQFGRAFTYETFVPAVRYPAVYYSWALGPWPRPLIYTWGWQAQPWYPAYGILFTPYPVYTSPDLWMTDYVIARSLQTAYQAQTPAPVVEPQPPQAPPPPAADDGALAPPVPPVDSSPPPSEVAPAPPAGDAPAAPTAAPPAITPRIKAQLNEQIRVQLREQQAAAATPATLTDQNTPPALRPNHVFFEVIHPLEVPADTAKGLCSLSTNDYIKRVGGMSEDDWKVPVVVELSAPSDCPQGLRTRVGLNDLNAMENEQEARVMEAMQAASPSLGPNGPPRGAHPTLIADGSAAPDPMALDAIRQAR